jgi:hypothetical protein
MRGGVIPPALLFVALGLTLALAPRSTRIPSLLVLLAIVGAFLFVPIPGAWAEGIFLGCWISVIVTVASVYLPDGSRRSAVFALSINAGVWASAVVAVSGTRLDLLLALPWVLIFLPASWIAARHGSIPIKVASSWVLAVAILAATLQLLPVTPGYLPDHLE